MSISSGAAAGGGSDAIEEILKQAFAQQIANRRAAQDDSRIKIEQQRADDERAYRLEAMRAANETRANAARMQTGKQADDLTSKLGEHGIGQELSTPDVSTLRAGGLGDTVKDPTLGSRNLSGMLRMVSGSEGPPALDLTSTPNPGKRETYLGTGPQQEQKQASDAYDQQVAATTDPIMRGKLQMLKSMIPNLDKRGPAAVELLKEQAKPDAPPTEAVLDARAQTLLTKRNNGQPLAPSEDAELKAYTQRKTMVPAFTVNANAGKADTGRLDKSYAAATSQIDKLATPVAAQVDRLSRLNDSINQRTPQADALLAPELMVAIAGGQGSGVRLTQTEINRTDNARSNWQSLEAALNKWQTDPSKALSITDDQRQQMRALIRIVQDKAQKKLKATDTAREALIDAPDVESHRRIVSGLHSELNDISSGSSDTGGGPKAPTVIRYDMNGNVIK